MVEAEKAHAHQNWYAGDVVRNQDADLKPCDGYPEILFIQHIGGEYVEMHGACEIHEDEEAEEVRIISVSNAVVDPAADSVRQPVLVGRHTLE